MADDQPGTLTVVATEMGLLLEPLTGAAEAAADGNDEAFPNLLDRMGVMDMLTPEQVTMVEETLDVASAWTTLLTKVVVPASEGRIPEADAIADGVEAIGEIFSSVDDLQDLQVEGLEDPGELGDRVVDFLIKEYLYTYHRDLYAGLTLAGVIQYEESTGLTRVEFGALATLVTDPASVPETVYDWGTPGFKSYVLVQYLGVLLDDVYSRAGVIPANVYDLTEAEASDRNLNRQLDVPILSLAADDEFVELGVGLVPVPPADPSNGPKKHPGLSLVPYGSGGLDETFELGSGWEFSTTASGELDQMGVVAQPDENGDLTLEFGELRDDHDASGELVKTDPPGGEINAEAALTYTGDDDGEGADKLLFGTEDGSGLTLRELALQARLHATEDGVTVEVELPSKLRLTVAPEGGFLEKLFPDDVTTDFELTPGYSTAKGVYFDGSVTLKLPIDVNVALGPVTIVEVYLELGFDTETGKIEPTIAISADGNLGPIDASVKRLGLAGALDFADDATEGADLGFANLATGFKPPDGAGLGLDTGPISGGGYIEHDPENERYAGVFTVSIGPVEVNIMGLLTTRMPDGSDGFSLLLNVFGEFPPVQLSFGFTLNGLGGVIGLNRALKPKELGKVVRSGSLGSLLFPDDPVANAQQIVSDLRSIYPPTRAQHVFGPMAKFGWGTPSIIQLSMGFVLQIPKFTVAIIGKLAVGLPALEVPKEAQLIRLNLAASGTLDPEAKLFAVDAVLYDSRVMLWAVEGGMAMRLGWGDKPSFVLAVGGFNPRFEPPESFPEVQRVTVSLKIPGGMPSVEWKGYFAVTSNTVQVGASFDARFEAGPVSARGWWGLDALFQFTPFKFVVDFGAGLKVTAFGMTLSVRLNGTISGPSPVHITGRLKVSLPGPLPDVSPKVDITLGSPKEKKQELPTVKVLPKFGTALGDPENWSAQLPAGGASIVSLRDVEPAAGQVLAHPLGRVSVRQTVVPITRTIERYGENRPKHVEFDFDLGLASGSDLPAIDEPVTEHFAPDQFRKMTDSEKMNAPSFERWTAGRAVSGDLFAWGCAADAEDGSTVPRPGNAASARMEYEHPQFDNEIERALAEAQGGPVAGGFAPLPTGAYPLAVSRSLADNGAVANAARRWRGDGKFVPEGPELGEVEVDSNYDLGGAVDGDAITVERGAFDTVADGERGVESPLFAGGGGGDGR